jgi:hypothetical protein
VFTRGSLRMRCNATPDAAKLLIVATSETCPRRIHLVVDDSATFVAVTKVNR